MKLSFAVILILSFGEVRAQTCSSGGCFTFTNQYPSGIFSSPSTSWARIQSTSGDALFNAGNYTKFSVVSGNVYEWSYCEENQGVSTSWDAQLTLFKSNVNALIAFSKAMAKVSGLGALSGIGTMVKGIAEGITAFFGGDPPIVTGKQIGRASCRERVCRYV